jgi:hypothetical protein
MDDIKQFVLNNRKNDTFEVFEALSPKIRWREKGHPIRQSSMSIDKL